MIAKLFIAILSLLFSKTMVKTSLASGGVLILTEARSQNFSTGTNSSDHSWTLWQTNSPSNIYGNRYDILWLDIDSMNFRHRRIMFDTISQKNHAMVSTGKFLWVNYPKREMKISYFDSLPVSFRQVTVALGYIPLSSSSGVSSFNTRTGAVTLTSGDVTGALGFTPYNATNPNSYITASSSDALSNKTGNISMWTNNSGYITASSGDNLTNKTGNISQWTNNSGYLTAEVDGSVTNELEPVGTINFYAGTSAPTGYLFCDGSAVSRTTYSGLFAVIGTTYGSGDGSTTFNLPDLRQRFPLGKAASGTGSSLAATGGAIDHVHAVDPPSTATDASANINNVTLLAIGSAASPSHTHNVDIAQFNSGANNPPYLVLNAIIKH